MSDALGRHALIIEDEMLIALEIEGLLEDLGFETIDIADNPRQALLAAKSHRPDLITADIRIIGGTGVEAVQYITDALGPIPVVYVTCNPNLVHQEGALVVDKPIVARVLAAACARACGSSA
jgi:CheY-like chemotaxis protein